MARTTTTSRRQDRQHQGCEPSATRAWQLFVQPFAGTWSLHLTQANQEASSM